MLQSITSRFNGLLSSSNSTWGNPFGTSINPEAATAANGAASLGGNFSQKEVISVSNVWKQGNWAIGGVRAILLVGSTVNFAIAVKGIVWNTENSTARTPTFSAKLKSLFFSTVVLAESALSLCSWAERVKLISLGKASFHTHLVSHALEGLVYLDRVRVSIQLENNFKNKYRCSQSVKEEKNLIKHRIQLQTLFTTFFAFKMAHGGYGFAETWQGKWPEGRSLLRRASEVMMCATWVASICYATFIAGRERAFKAQKEQDKAEVAKQ